MKFLSMFVSFLSGLCIALGAAYIAVGVWGISSPEALADLLGGGWASNDYLVWGLVLPILGYLGLMRARTDVEARSDNG